MHLTQHTDYGLRVLMYAAIHSDRRVPMREIAKAYGISSEHLRKVVHRLARHGYLETTQGPTGGITLRKSPESIPLGEAVQVLEQSLEIVDCDRQPCPLRGSCALKQRLNAARDSFLEELNTSTIADLVRDQHTVARLQRLPVSS